jgi:hypothetical protein
MATVLKAAIELEDACLRLKELALNRKAIIKAQIRANNQLTAFVVRYLAPEDQEINEEDEKARKRRWAKAARLVKHLQKGNELNHPAYGFALATEATNKELASVRERYEECMVALVREMPAYSWWMTVPGLGEIGLATIIGETGDLSDYSVSKLWKRLGLAPTVEYTMKKKNGEDCICKPKAKRSVVWNVGDVLIKVNKKDGKNGHYRQLYIDRKEYECQREPELRQDGKKMKAHRHAQKYMEKRLIKHLWQQWNRQPIKD